MIGMEIIVIRHSIIRRVRILATTVSCVGAVGVVMRGAAVFRTVPASILSAVSMSSVCASPSQFDNDREVIYFIHSKLKKGFCCG